MFKNVKLMKNGWLARNEFNLITTLILAIILFISHLFIYRKLDTIPNVYDASVEESILMIVALFNLHNINKIISLYHNEQFERINHILKDLHTIPKIYDKFFTLFTSLIPFIFLILVGFLTSGMISLILCDLAYFLILMDLGLLMDTLFALKHLKILYK